MATLPERMDSLEKSLEAALKKQEGILESVRKTQEEQADVSEALFENTKRALKFSSKFLDCMVEVLKELHPEFQEKLSKSLQAQEDKENEARMAQEKAQLEHLVAGGHLKAAESVSDTSIVVGKVSGPDGKVLAGGRTVIQMGPQMPEAVKATLLGKTVGSVAELGGEKVEILEVYTPPQLEVPAPAVVTTEPPPSPAPETGVSSS